MLEIKGLYKSFGKKEVLKGVDLEVKEGEVKGLIGVNGAGKSTLIECVCGLKTADAGEIFLFGKNCADRKVRKTVKAQLGYMPQSFRLFNDLTAEENLKYLCAVYRLPVERAAEVMDLCKIKEVAKTLAGDLSGGYRQLLSMASALIHSPKFLIMDEPTAAMDPIFRRQFWEILHGYKKNGATFLVITHYFEELVECDSFVCLADGKAAFDGSLSEFKADGLLNIEEILNKYTFEKEDAVCLDS